MVVGEGPLSGFTVSSHRGRGGVGVVVALWGLIYQGTNPIPGFHAHDLDSLSKVLPPNTNTSGVRISTSEF